MKKIMTFVAVALLAVGAVGCHTVRGAGEDVRSIGRGVEGAAQGARNP